MEYERGGEGRRKRREEEYQRGGVRGNIREEGEGGGI